jgi:hypothetical protein
MVLKHEKDEWLEPEVNAPSQPSNTNVTSAAPPHVIGPSTFLTLERIQTWNYITDNLLIKAKTYGFIEVDCRMEHMVRDQKVS